MARTPQTHAPVSFPLAEVPEKTIGRIAGHMDTHDALLLWMTGDKRIQNALEAHTKEVCAILPAGFWAVPWPLLSYFKSMRKLTIGFPKFATHWVFAEMPEFSPMTQLTELNLQSPSLVSLIKEIGVSFPNLTHLTLFVRKAGDIKTTEGWKMPLMLESIIIETPPELPQSSSNDKLKLDVAKVPWLLRLPDNVHTMHIDLYLKLDISYNAAKFKWPRNLKHLKCKMAAEFYPDYMDSNDPLPAPVSLATTDSGEVVASATDYAKAMRAAKKIEKEMKSHSETPVPSASPIIAPVVEVAPYFKLPRKLETVDLKFSNSAAMPDPNSLPPRIRSFRMQCDSMSWGSRYSLQQIYEARPTLTDLAYFGRNSPRRDDSTFLINTLPALQALPPYIEYLNLSLCHGHIKISDWAKNVPKHVTELDLWSSVRDTDNDTSPSAPVINVLPPQLRKIRLHLKHEVSIRFPDTVTSISVPDSRLKSDVVMPRSLTELSIGYHHSANLSIFPSCLTSLTLMITLDKIGSASFSPRHLPICLRHFALRATPIMSHSTQMIKWWASMPRDLPLETLSLTYTDHRTSDPKPYPYANPLLMPYIHPTLYSLTATLYEYPIQLSSHIIENLPKQLKSLSIGVFNAPTRPCPLLPDSAIDKLPPLLDEFKSNLFDIASLKRWHRHLAARQGTVFKDDQPHLYAYY